ncbi:MAG: BamA/TamA family outer membrane protein, partial [Endomicrobium sp.]|nr:BamA/TamA family outer membrane protein [Endomicrobium sp.]
LDVFFLIDEGKIFYFGNLYINGLVHTKDKVLRREMLLRPGDVFSPEKYLKSINMIYNLGFIKNVDHNMLQNEVSNVVDLNFNVVEENINDLRKIGTAIGFEYPYNPLFLIKFSKINMFGLGQSLNLFYEISKKQKKYDINWIYPWVFDKNIDFILDFYKRDNKIIFKNKKKGILEDIKKNGFEAKLSPRINKKIVFPFGYRYENVYFCSKSIDNDAILKIENNKISSVFSHFLYDSTDCILDPSSGNLESITFQIASKIFGGDTNFVKCIVNSKLFFPILHKFVLSINFRFGLIAEYFNQQIPTSELFFMGGADTVRGYDIDETEHYDGGKFMGIINMECKFPIITKCKKTIVQGFLFYDIGTLGKDDNAIYQGFGIGIGIPANVFGINFPIRFDLSQGLRDKFKPKFYFSLINRI